jgi:hypothetical protein
MATASEVVADIIHLRKTGDLGLNEGYVSANWTFGTVVTNPIYQVPSDKYAEVIVHIWRDVVNQNDLQALCAGPLGGSASNRYEHLRYNLTLNNSGLLAGGIQATTVPNRSYGDNSGSIDFKPKDLRLYLAPNDYIFRAGVSQTFGSSNLWWDMTIILRNQP